MASCTTALLVAGAMAVVVGALLPATVSEDTYVVGEGYEDEDGYGWTLGVDYSKWANGQTFYIGDILEFQYNIGSSSPHNVVQVDQANFQACNANMEAMNTGDDKVSLNYAGQQYFISGIQGDCQAGMKLTVNVAQRPPESADGPAGSDG